MISKLPALVVGGSAKISVVARVNWFIGNLGLHWDDFHFCRTVVRTHDVEDHYYYASPHSPLGVPSTSAECET